MQAAAQELRESLWASIRPIYGKYSKNNNGEISVNLIEQIVVDVLHEETQAQKDYVIKNMFRLDQDGNGTVSYLQFTNFLFKKHCGEMSLQKEHMNGKMSRGNERKMTSKQFHRLMNNAYKFLGVTCSADIAQQIFQKTDKDKDQLITYAEYFEIIENYVCKTTKVQSKVQVEKSIIVTNSKIQRHSKLRIYIWSQLKKLYIAHVKGRYLPATDLEIRHLIIALIGQLSESELIFLSTRLLLLLHAVNIEMVPFCIHFIEVVAELGLSRFSRNNHSSKKVLNCAQFIVVFKNSFSFLKISTFKNSILQRIFAKVDKNSDGLISFEQYLEWIRKFLAVEHYHDNQFYTFQDDDDLCIEDAFEKSLGLVPPSQSVLSKPVQFKFSDYTLAHTVRERVYYLLTQFDINKDEKFDEEEINNALITMLRENKNQLRYVTKNVFRYDKDNDNNITYDEFTNFCVEQHFGQMAIQRLHKNQYYSKGKERIMNKAEFSHTLNHVLEYIQLTATHEQVDRLFNQIDTDEDGWIRYELYFRFLKLYFGSQSLSATQRSYSNYINFQSKVSKVVVVIPTESEIPLESVPSISVWEKFVRLYLDQLRVIFLRFDYNQNLVFEEDQIQAILDYVFKLTKNEIGYILQHYFTFDTYNRNVTFEQFVAIILSIYFIEIFFTKKYKYTNSKVWSAKRINLEEFIALMLEGSFFLELLPSKIELTEIFHELDDDKDGYITFTQYADFIKKYLGNGLELKPSSKIKFIESVKGVSKEQLTFIDAVWGELKMYFDKYDQGKKEFLSQVQLRSFVIEVLHETTQRELHYIFWNMFRADPNFNKEIQFCEFAPFILNHAGEISLQRFHREQVSGKNSLSNEQLFIVFSNAFRFLSRMPKQKEVVSMIFARIQENGVVSYARLLAWIHNSLSKRFK